MFSRLKTLLIGFGNVAEKIGNDKLMGKFIKYQSHSQVLNEHPNYLWDAVIEKDKLRREVAKKKWKIPIVVSTPEKLPQDYTPDVVVLTTPPESRLNILENIKVKKAVLVEKPLGTSLELSKKFEKICKDKNLMVQVNYFRRFDSTNLLLIEKKLEKKLGKLQVGFCVYGNGLRNNAIHMIDLTRMFFGNIKSIRAIAQSNFGTNSLKNDKNIIFNLEFSGGSIITFKPINFEFYRDVYLDLWGTKGRVEIYQEGLFVRYSPLKSHRAIENKKEISIDNSTIEKTESGKSYFNVYDNLYISLKKNIKPRSDIHNAIKNEIVLDNIYKSLAQNSKKIKVDI